MKRLGRIARVLALLLLSLVATTLVLAAALLYAARTEWGRAKLLGYAVARIRPLLAGKISVGRLEGDLTRTIVLRDLALDDAEGQPAIRAARAEAHYELWSLLRASPHIDEVRVDGIWLRMRNLGDGRFNFAALGVPSPEAPPPPKADEKPADFSLRHVVLDGVVRYEPPTDRKALRVIEGHAHAEGRVDFGAKVLLSVAHLDVVTSLPAPLTLNAHGGLAIDSGGGGVAMKKIAVGIELDGEALHRALPEAHARGHFTVQLDADGPTDAVAVSLHLQAPRGTVAADGRLGLPGDHFTWRGTLRVDDLDPGAAWVGIPHAQVSLAASAVGSDGQGTIRLARLVATAAGARAQASGHSDLEGFGELEAQVDAGDLARLRSLGAPALGGRLHAHAHVTRSRRALAIDGEAHVLSLVAPPFRIDQLDVRVATVDLAGQATAVARGVTAGTIRLAHLSVRARGDRKSVALKVDSDGPRSTRVALQLQGVPLYANAKGGRPVGVDGQLEGVLFLTPKRFWSTSGPAAVHVDGDVARIVGLRLKGGEQRIALDGSWRSGGALDATLRADALDARELELLLAPGKRLPQTNVHLGLHLQGTTAAPIVDMELRGTSKSDEATGLLQITAAVTARYAAGRVRGDVDATIAGQSLKAHVDLPTTRDGRAPASGQLALNLLFDPIMGDLLLPELMNLMPGSMQRLQGKVSAEATLSGTVGAPRLAARVRAGTWGSSAVKGSADLALDYRDAAAEATLGVRLSSLPRGGGEGGGTFNGHLAAAIDLGSLLELPERLAERVLQAPLTVTVSAAKIDLQAIPFAAFGIDAPLAAGTVGGTVGISGTAGNPIIAVELDGKGLAGFQFDRADLSLFGEYHRPTARLDASVTLRGAPLLHVRGSAELDPAHLANWRAFPIHLDGEVPPYPLERMPELASSLGGTLAAELSLGGTLGRPNARARIHADHLSLGTLRFPRFVAGAGFDDGIVTVALDAIETEGSLHLEAMLPLAASRRWSALAQAHDFRLELDAASLPGLRTIRGTLNADLQLGGTRARPTIAGSLRVEHGALALSASPMLYHDLALDLAFDRGRVVLRRFDLAAAGGNLQVSAEGRLDGLTWTALDAHAQLRKFPLRQSGIDAWIDARVDLQAKREGETLRGRVVVREALARVADLVSGRSLQATGTPTDVTYVDAAGRRATEARARTTTRNGETELLVSIEGPLLVRSSEVSADLGGQLRIHLVTDAPTIAGTIESRRGSIVLFSRRYEIDRARVAFDGSSELDPQLDIRLSRAVADATIVVEVHGTAAHPEVVFTSLPPVYSESQIVGMILSGDAGAVRISDSALDSQVAGALSSVVVGALKQQLAPGLPIDVMKVDLERDLTGVEQMRLEVGKYIGAGIYVSYVHQFSGASGLQRLNQNQLQVDYRLTRSILLQSQFGDAGAGGFDLFWSHRF